MNQSDKKLSQIRKVLEEAEEKIQTAKRILFEQVYQEQAENLDTARQGAATIVEGVFDGEEMIDKNGRKYTVPANYSSKSKLVPGDKLKLTIAADGAFVFKQIGPVERRHTTGKLLKVDDNWIIACDGKKYKCLQASVTYFKANPDDKVTIILPKNGESEYAAIENLIKE